MHASDQTMSATMPSPAAHDHPDTAGAPAMAAGGRREAEAGIDTIRAAAADLGERMPELFDTVRTGAADGARAIQAWPEPNQRLLAVFSAGVGVGLMIAGAPRLLVAGALLPAFAVAASTMGRETNGARRPL